MTDISLKPAPLRAGWALHLGERWSLALRLTLSMIAAGMLILAVLWQLIFPTERAIADLVAGGAAILVAVPVLAAAWSSLRQPTLHGITDQLVAIALLAAWATGELMTAAILPIVMIIGHVLEERSLLGSREAIRTLGHLVETETRRLNASGAIETVPTAVLAIGDRIELRAGDKVPADGIVRDGCSSVDAASLTGESVPVEIGEGDMALAGSINLDGRLIIEVTRLGAETTLGRIIALMREAEGAKPPVTRLLEHYAGQYIALVLIVAAATWFATGKTAAMLAVLVASCPCALVLAAPATAIAAIAVAARHGILIKGSAFLENLAEVTSVVFDKTGTLTIGELTVVGLEPAGDVPETEIARLASALGATSSHPVSRALAMLAAPGERPAVERVSEARGFGVTARIAGKPAALGRPELFRSLGFAVPAPPGHDGPIAGLGYDGAFLGWLLLADEPRSEALEALDDLRRLGLTRQILLTGDRQTVAARVGASLGITEIRAEALPEEKMARVLEEIHAGQRPMVVGDGINDSLALKVGAVGVAMGARGTDIALASADLVLMTNDLRRLGTCIRLSRRCRRTIHVNVGLGLGWTLILIALAAGGLLGAEGAIIAAIVHNLSTFLGMANAGRLLLFDEMRRDGTLDANAGNE